MALIEGGLIYTVALAPKFFKLLNSCPQLNGINILGTR